MHTVGSSLRQQKEHKEPVLHVPKLKCQIVEILNDTEMIGDTPRPVFVFSVIPRARIRSPMR